MRIIAGEFKGRQLKSPKGEGTRPTTDRVRESLMSMIISRRGSLEGAYVLDAFAGSGALGLEALSRGAECACFCERDGAALKVVEANCALVRAEPPRIRTVSADVLKRKPPRMAAPYDVVFLDPPYALDPGAVLGALALWREGGIVAHDALAAYEHDASSDAAVDGAVTESGMVIETRRNWGDTVIDFIRFCSSGSEGAGK